MNLTDVTIRVRRKPLPNQEHGLDDLETRNINGRVHMQEDSGVAKQLLDAEVEHHTIAAVEFHGVLANLEDFFGGE